MTTWRESLDVQRMVALDRMIDRATIMRQPMQTVGGRTLAVGASVMVAESVPCALRVAGGNAPIEQLFAERQLSAESSVVMLPIGTNVEINDVITVVSPDGWSRIVTVRAKQPQRTNDTHVKVLAEEIG